MDGVNWAEVSLGFLLGLTPLAMRQVYILIKYTRLPGRRKYLGVWWAYHRSTTGSGHVFERRLDVKYSLLTGKLSIYAKSTPTDDDRNVPLVYSGQISARQGMVRYIELHDPASHERVMWYLFDPFYDPVPSTVGLYIALDLRGLPAAGPLYLSRERASTAEIDTKLDPHVLRVQTLLDNIEQSRSRNGKAPADEATNPTPDPEFSSKQD